MSLAAVIERHARQSPHKTALHFAGEDISYLRLWQSIEAACERLVKAGVKQGDRMAYLGLNHPAMLVLLFALARIGAILLPLNYRLAPAELVAILLHAQAGHIVADDTHASVARDLASQANCRLFAASGFCDLTAAQLAVRLEPVETGVPVTSSVGSGQAKLRVNRNGIDDAHDASSPVLLVYTSGTTGKPKGALHTQAGLLANCVASGDAHGFMAADHVLTVLPMFHVGGLCIQTLPALYFGARVTIHARFDPAAWLADVQRLRPSLSLLVPATLHAVLEQTAFVATDLSSLKLLNAGSSTIPASLIAAFHARQVPVCQVYGATETGPVSIYLKPQDAGSYAGSAGRAGLNVEVRLVDTKGADVPDGQVGEIRVRAPNVMARYWRDEGNPSFVDGWFHSGDLAWRDMDGFYWIVGRSKDMIISGGENIYPAEIENLLAACPLVQECAVVGQPDAKWGEAVVAVIVKRPGAALDAAGVMALLDGKLARFKQPRRVVFAASLPKTALGKVQKAELLSWLQQQQMVEDRS